MEPKTNLVIQCLAIFLSVSPIQTMLTRQKARITAYTEKEKKCHRKFVVVYRLYKPVGQTVWIMEQDAT